MGDLDLAGLKAILAEATPGPWVRCKLANITTKIDKHGCRDGAGNTWPVEYTCYRGPMDDELATAAVNSLPALIQRIEALEEALGRIRDGDEPRPIGTHYYPDKRVSKHNQCIHGVWMYDACGNCVEEFARATLTPTKGR